MWLPVVATADDYRKVDRQNPAHARAVAHICALHGIPAERLRPFPQGSSIVYAVGDEFVIKLYPPIFTDEWRTESEVLQFVAGAAALPAPQPVAAGSLEDWDYLIMTRVPGVELKSVWAGLPRAARLRLAVQLGALVSRLHDLPQASIPLSDEWPAFLQKHLTGCTARHKRLGLPSSLLDRIPAFLEPLQVDLRLSAGRVLLHTEVMVDHLFAREDPEGWNLTGLIDFEPAMIGPPEYEFPAVGLFVAGGDPAVLGSFFAGYGYTRSDLTPDLSRRIMAYTLLHRYSDLTWYLEFMPHPGERKSFDSLAGRWFGFATEEEE